MELLGIGANMQSSSNYPKFYFSRDLKGVVSGCIWPQISDDRMVKGGHSSNGFLSPLSADLYVGYGREALKQIMLKQEAIFRDQIYELHRLYQRQREFIAEMKRESCKHDICIETTQSDFYKSKVSMMCAQDAHDFHVYNQSSITGGEKTLLLSTQGKSILTGSASVLNGICSKNLYLSEYKSKIWGKEMFDLQLPTDGKHVNEKDESSEMHGMSSCHLKGIPGIVCITDGKPFLSKYDLNASLYRDSSTTDSYLEKTKVSVDLNNPLNFAEEPGCRSVDLMDSTDHREIPFHDLYGKTNSKFLVFSEQDIHGRYNGYPESSSFYDRSKTYQPVPDKDISNSSLSSSTTSLKKSAQDSIRHPILETGSSKTLIENLMLAEDDLCSVKNLRSSIGFDSVSHREGSFCNGSKSGSVKEESHSSFKASANWIEGQIDLNVCINEEFLSTPFCSTEIKLEVPVSPRKETHSSTGGEFDDNQVGTHFMKSVQDDGKPSEDLIAIAAETLVSISSSVAQNFKKTTSYQSAQASCESICWFAEIVSSMGGDPEKAETDLKSEDTGDSEELLPNCTDDFEAMTLKLKETKVKGCSLTISDPKEETVKKISPSSCRLGTGHARLGERNNFQTEVIPSLASLSRYEVNEDIHTIGGLMVETVSSQSIPGAAKNASRTAWKRGKRRSCNSSLKTKETVIGSIMDQVSSSNELENKERNIIDWGNITRRRRGQRYPACSRKIVLGQV